MLRTLTHGLALVGSLLLAQPAAALTVTLDPGGWTTGVIDRAAEGIFSFAESTSFPASFPETGTTSGAVHGASSAVVDYALSHTGFEVDFDQIVAALTGSFSQSSAFIYFSPDADAAYAISGDFQVSDSEGRSVYLRTALVDITGAPATLFESNQHSEATPDESFTVGLLEGDTSNLLTGSATGTLLAGHVYRFYADAALESYPDLPRTTTASGAGGIRLVLVPEPSAALLTGLGLAALALAGGRRARAGS